MKIKEGDKVYRRNAKPTTTKGPWEANPHKVTKVVHNRVTAVRGGVWSTRDISDWKLVKDRPEHLTTAKTGPAESVKRTNWLDPDDDDWTRGRTNPRRLRQTPGTATKAQGASTTTTTTTPPPPPPPPRRPRAHRHLCRGCKTLIKTWQGDDTCACEA